MRSKVTNYSKPLISFKGDRCCISWYISSEK